MLLRAVSFLGLFVMVVLAWLCSEDRKIVPWRVVLWGLGLQFALGVLLLRTPLAGVFFKAAQAGVNVLTQSTLHGAQFVFGPLSDASEMGVIFAFQILPVIIFVSALSAILLHLRVIQGIVSLIAVPMRRTLKTSGAETFQVALMILMGIESATAVRPYLKSMTRSELATILTAHMSTIAGSVMVVYASFGAKPGHLLTASLMNAPAAILVAKLMVPEREQPETTGGERIQVPIESHNVVDAAARGTSQGLYLALNVGAMLIVFVGLVYMMNLFCESVFRYSFTEIMGWFFRPFAFLLGIPLRDVAAVGELLGTKSVLNEFLAYVGLRDHIQAGTLSPRSVVIATYALCGFANPGSLGIAIACMTGLVPERRVEIVQLGLKSLIGGTLACFTTACVAGILLNE